MTTQLPLLAPPPFVPLALGSTHYVAALQNRSGELRALAHAPEGVWERFTPLAVLVGPPVQPAAYRSETVGGWLRRLSDAVGEHPLFLDVMRLEPERPVRVGSGAVPLLERVYWAARRRHLQFVPVAWVGDSTPAHLTMVRQAQEADGRGAALRHRIMGLAVPAGQQAGYLAGALAAIGTPVENSDLIIDLDYLDDEVDVDVGDLATSIRAAMDVGDWRSVVLMGTSMPSMLSCVREGTVGSLPRREWELWTALADRRPDRMPAFGDYAIQHSRPPGGGGPSMRANIRYTIDRVTLVARGKGSVLQEGLEQYVELCHQLVELQAFHGRDYSWGDSLIQDCADERIEPGGQNMWRGAGTSHHICFVTDQLRRRAAEA